MRVLIIVASKHGGTLEIGEAIASELRARGAIVEVRPVDEVSTVRGHDAVVFGSAIYLGHWMREASWFVERHLAEFRSLPVWLFSSGPIGDPPLPTGDSAEAIRLCADVAARGHRTFAGRLEMDSLGLGDHTVATMLCAPSGDFRRWDEVRAWAAETATALTLDPVTVEPSGAVTQPQPLVDHLTETQS